VLALGMTVSPQTKPIKMVAANQVLKRMGMDMYNVVQWHLSHHYHIRLAPDDKSSYSLEELNTALQNLIGPGAAELIMQDIYLELEELSSTSRPKSDN